MGSSFSADQITRMIYGEELVTYTWGPATLTANAETTVFDVSGWNDANAPDKIVILEAWAATQNANVQVQVLYDGKASDSAEGFTDAFPGGVNPAEIYFPATDSMKVILTNGGAAADNYQFNYTVRVRKMTIAEKLLRKLPLSPDDLELMTVLNDTVPTGKKPYLAPAGTGYSGQIEDLVTDGTLPIDFSRTYDALVRNRRLPDPTNVVPRHFKVGSSGVAQTIVSPSPGAALLLLGVALEGGASPERFVVTRDQQAVSGQSGYVDVNGAAFANTLDLPFPLLVWARRQMQLQVYGSDGTTYLVRPIIRSIALSTLLRLRLGLTEVPRVEYAKVRGGFR